MFEPFPAQNVPGSRVPPKGGQGSFGAVGSGLGPEKDTGAKKFIKATEKHMLAMRSFREKLKREEQEEKIKAKQEAVSYTHLTLPTIYSV